MQGLVRLEEDVGRSIFKVRVSGLGLKFSDMFPRRHSYFRFVGQIARIDFMSHPRGATGIHVKRIAQEDPQCRTTQTLIYYNIPVFYNILYWEYSA